MRKILYLYQGHDAKFEKDFRVKRPGTPVLEMIESDMPSPPPQKNIKIF
jgi:hypothetical protein